MRSVTNQAFVTPEKPLKAAQQGYPKMFIPALHRARHGVKLTPSMRVINRANIHTSPTPANNNIQPPSWSNPFSVNSVSKPTISRRVSIEALSGVETSSASETPIRGTKNSKFLLLLCAILALAAFASFGPEIFKTPSGSFVDTLLTRTKLI